MKKLSEILESKRIITGVITPDGGSGFIKFPLWQGTVVWSTGAGWDHVSVSPSRKRDLPTWDDMCKLKYIFFYEDEAVIQIHPPKDQYVNNVDNCLHLWRCTYKEMVLPPSVLVGIREGQTPEEVREEIKAAYEMAGEKY